MSGYTLKLIAMITMLIDHMTAILVPVTSPFYLIGRIIGRVAFPIYCFLIVEGLKHTSNIKKYLLRLLIFAFLSEIPFDFAFYDPMNTSEHFNHQNVFFTLFIGLLVIAIMDYLQKYFTDKYLRNNNDNKYLVLLEILNLVILFIGCVFAFVLNTDYSFVGVLSIWAFYKFKDKFTMLFIALALLNYLYGFPQVLAVLALIFIKQYNGQKGKEANKFLFYGFYPIHLIVLSIVKSLIH